MWAVTALLAFLSYEGTCVQSIKCTHDHLPATKFFRSDQKYILSRRAESYAQLRVAFDTRYLSNVPAGQQNTIATLLDYVKGRLSSALKVIPITGNLFVPRRCDSYWTTPADIAGKCASTRNSSTPTNCGGATVPDEHFAPITVTDPFGVSRVIAGGVGIPNADVLVYVTAIDTIACSGSTLAYANSCFMDQMDRPIVGNINFCLQNAGYSQMSIPYQQMVVLHEMVHVLGFSSSLFPFFRNENGLPRTPRCPGASGCTAEDQAASPHFDKTTLAYVPSESTVITQAGLKYIVTPAVTAVARAYYACEALPGAPLEDLGSSGTAGSHWKERMLYTELMTGQIDNNFSPVLSEFTLALLADSGWYRVDLSAADAAPPMRWRRGEGCGAFAASCAAGTFCAVQAQPLSACTFERSAVGYCAGGDSMMDSCAVVIPYSNRRCDNSTGKTSAPLMCSGKSCYGTYVGPDSACFDSSLAIGTSGAPGAWGGGLR
jgi:leishmanolysin-like peptidase